MQRPFLRLALLALVLGLCVAPFAGAADAKPAETNAPAAGLEKSLFDGKTLQGWAITDFAGHGEVRAEKEMMVLEQGYITGVHFTNAVPQGNYELSLEARRVVGNDFFCGLTFPIAGTNVTLIVGGWGGGVVGISSIDGYDASENETTKFMGFERNKWYAVRVRVTKDKLEAWLDKEQVVNVNLAGKKLGLRSGPIEQSVPLGIATFDTTAHLRNLKLRLLDAPAPAPASK